MEEENDVEVHLWEVLLLSALVVAVTVAPAAALVSWLTGIGYFTVWGVWALINLFIVLSFGALAELGGRL